MVKTYSKRTQGEMKLSPHFRVREFACKDGSDTILIDDALAKLLADLRSYFNKPIIITSAYRTPAYNKKIGGTLNSQHTKGTAADIVVKGIDPKEVAIVAEKLMPKTGGIGYYPISSFVHVDTRKNRSRFIEYSRNKTKACKGFYDETE